jgi:hypothetical protein
LPVPPRTRVVALVPGAPVSISRAFSVSIFYSFFQLYTVSIDTV